MLKKKKKRKEGMLPPPLKKVKPAEFNAFSVTEVPVCFWGFCRTMSLVYPYVLCHSEVLTKL